MIKGAVMNEHKKHGSSFSSKMGFILAAAGSAVGLGNLWRFLTLPQNTVEVLFY